MGRSWSDVVGEISAAIASMRWGQFVVIDYDRQGLEEEAPYAQASFGANGWYAEVASDANIAFWRHDDTWFRDAGWERPSDDDNWQRELPDPEELARQLVDGLQFGHGCLLPDLFTVHVDRFEPPPDGGLPEPSTYCRAA